MNPTPPTSPDSKLDIAAGFASDIGKRDENQDFAALCLEDGQRLHGAVAALADGVGGRKGGRVAAELSVRTFIDDYLGQSELLSPRKTAARALESINYWLFREGQKNENLKGMCAAFTGVVIKGRRLHSFHAGDTRLYRLRAGQLELLTQDHKPEGADGSSFITRAVGAEEAIRIDYGAHDIFPHDRLMLCSDGVHGFVSQAQILALLDARTSPDETAQKLVSMALAHGGDDNATAMVIDVIDLPPATIEDLNLAIAKLPMIEPPHTGETIDGFRLDRQLADGIYSRVFRARDMREFRTGVSPHVVLKFPKPHTIGSESSARSAFMREAWVASRVQHMWIGSVLDIAPGRQTCLYVAQPYYAGETLEHRLSRAPKIRLEEGVAIATKLAKALGSLHRAGIIHRDVKPENIILMPEGGFKLVDLGVARIPGIDKDSLFVPGTPSYKAPELFDGKPGDERSDIFAMGVTLYRLFTGGAYPFGEIETGQTPKFSKPELLTSRRRDLPAWLDSLILQALAPHPQDRFQDGFEMAFKLETGAHGAEPDFFRKHSWLGRNQISIWRGVSLVLALMIVAMLLAPDFHVHLKYGWQAVIDFLTRPKT
ncbi:Serine/threonine-protein kinase PknD [Asticcacaulis sp. MM231]|uniref:protein kinase domain-containing protein n=1 Tax=Asticcacaulis sp. MM231 TaxID=3157666 RepID=UPI0032D56A37